MRSIATDPARATDRRGRLGACAGGGRSVATRVSLPSAFLRPGFCPARAFPQERRKGSASLHLSLAPAVATIAASRVRSVPLGEIAPWCPCRQHLRNVVHDKAIVLAFGTPAPRRQRRRGPLGVRQFVSEVRYPHLLLRDTNLYIVLSRDSLSRDSRKTPASRAAGCRATPVDGCASTVENPHCAASAERNGDRTAKILFRA